MDYRLLATTQGRLKSLGYYTGAVDNQHGPLTALAVVDFKRAHGLRPRDLIGPVTSAALWSHQAKRAPVPQALTGHPGDPPWLAIGRSLIGTDEAAGRANNLTIMAWADELDQWYPDDATPWCGLFVAHCMAKGAPGTPQDFNRLGARAWGAYGDPAEAWLGAIVTMWRTHPTRSWNGHVGLLVAQSETHFEVLGGNQSDSVNIKRFPRDRVLNLRGPIGWKGKPAPFINSHRPLSYNEA